MPAAPKYCPNCGQEVSKPVALSPDGQPACCFRCGAELNPDGTCPNEDHDACEYAGTVPPKPPKSPTGKTFCTTCGQPVKGAVAKAAHSPKIVYCWKCGLQLDKDGLCQNEDCKFFGKDPGSPPQKK